MWKHPCFKFVLAVRRVCLSTGFILFWLVLSNLVVVLAVVIINDAVELFNWYKLGISLLVLL